MTLTGAATATTTFTVPELTGPTTLTFTLTVTDAGGSPGTGRASGTDEVVVTINADNDLPTADAGTDQTVSEGDAVTLSGSGQDPENAALSYAWTQTGGTPTVTLTGATTTTATFSIPELTGATALTFQLSVTAGGASVTDTVVVTVNADNDAPTAEAGSEQFIHEGTVVTLTGSGEDPENTALSYAWTQTGGSPTVTLTGAATTTATFTAPELVEDVTLTFTLTVTDAGGASGTDTVAIRVWANNDAPTAAAGSDQTVSEGDAVTLTGTGQDPEQSVLTYAWRQTGGAPTMTLTGAATATTTFTVPELTGPTTLTFTLTVTDAGGSPGTGRASGTDEVVVTINADNDLPTADAGTDQTVSEGDAVTLSGSGQDPENAALSYAWTQTGGTPTVTLTGATTTTATFSIPELTGPTALTFQLTVTAGGASVTDEVVVTVNADNDAPTAEAGSEQFIHEGTVVTLTGSGEDPENTALSYAWTQTGGSPTVTLTGGTTTTATFTAPELVEDVTLTFTLTVTDAGGASGTDTVAIRVWANNDAPTAAAGSDQTVSEGDAVTLTGTGQDPEQSVLTYAWRQTGGSPTMTLTGAATATTTFTVPELTGPTTLTFTLTVTDAGGSPGTGRASGTDVVVVTINADNDLPTADAGTDQTVSEGDAVTLSGSGQDPENAALSYAWTQTGGTPTVTLTGATTTTATFSIPELTGATALTFQLTVTAGGASVTDTVVVTVNADNDAPTAEAGSEQFIHEGTVVTLTGSGEDPENTALSYAWTQTGGSPTVTLTGGTTTTADVHRAGVGRGCDPDVHADGDGRRGREWHRHGGGDHPSGQRPADGRHGAGGSDLRHRRRRRDPDRPGRGPGGGDAELRLDADRGGALRHADGGGDGHGDVHRAGVEGAHDPDVHADGDRRRGREWHRHGDGPDRCGQRPAYRRRRGRPDGARRGRRDSQRPGRGPGGRYVELRLDADRGGALRPADGGYDGHGDVHRAGASGGRDPDVHADGHGWRCQCDRHGGDHGADPLDWGRGEADFRRHDHRRSDVDAEHGDSGLDIADGDGGHGDGDLRPEPGPAYGA